MSTWHVLACDGDSYRWELSSPLESELLGGVQRNPPSSQPDVLPSSMSGVVRQGRSKLLEGGDQRGEVLPVFRTGSGKSVPWSRSSFAKALSILEDGGDDETLPGSGLQDCRPSSSSILFQTGSGKTIRASSASLDRAKRLLGLKGDEGNNTFQVVTGTENATDVSGENPFEVSPQMSMPCASVGNVRHTMSHAPMPSSSLTCEAGSYGALDVSCYATTPVLQANSLHTASSPIKFLTAGGRSISISGDAMKRARSLLGDPEMGGLLKKEKIVGPSASFSYPGKSCDSLSCEEKLPPNIPAHPEQPKRHDKLKSFVSPLRPTSNKFELSNSSKNLICSNNLAQQFDVAFQKNAYGNSMKQLARGSLQEENKYGIICSSRVHVGGESRKVGQIRFSSPFKKPRSSKFLTPLISTLSFSSSGRSTSIEHNLSKEKVSVRFPPLLMRPYVKEYFDGPPHMHESLQGATSLVRSVGPDNVENFMLPNASASGSKCIGVGDFFRMLVQSGASSRHISDQWVRNHCKWIIWKLASYERCYPATCSGKFLTIPNVLEELKYRYEREINHGQHSAIKRILEGDASPAKVLVLCVSAVHCPKTSKLEATSLPFKEATDERMKKIEVTDGWYSLNAILDEQLSRYLTNKKIFVGQKIRICGAGLHGWNDPISPLQAGGSVSFLLHANGTYRAHWADRLGFHNDGPPPLSFRCIKSNGGKIPLTLVGVSRIYPILYRERSFGSSVVRSEKMELKMRQLYDKKRSVIVDAVVSEYEKNKQGFYHCSDSDTEEGAKILNMLENSAEPEVLMAQMSAGQLNSFSSYQSKLEVSKQNHLDKLIQNAIRDAGLTEREVTSFMRVRVVGLRRRDLPGEDGCDEGFITIWEPTDSQQHDLIEGKAYAISSLIPVYSNLDTLYLQAKGSTVKWRPLSSREYESFKPFFNPRSSTPLSLLGEIPFSSEFDTAAFVLYVGEVHESAQQKQQWVFVTDGTNNDRHMNESDISILAISFALPCSDDLTPAPINSNLAGSTVGFCNLIRRANDQINHVWVAEASENSNYFLNFNVPYCKHLKGAAASVEAWASTYEMAIKKLRERVSIIIGEGRS
ncbi:hypothetical protein MLD38_037816 [Melastoma candidum]|uniref:Uncharacterized protein n=1 Tax=Melastoma candidum TaxID=119954 RepID=A0ACB9LN79_9MYRT|nr:hypothetical protein MLD38_037816 [Melastoma candidum]